MTGRARVTALAVLALLQLVPLATRPSILGGDEPHYALMAHSMAEDGDLALEDDYEAVRGGSAAAGRKRAGTALEPHLAERRDRVAFTHPLGLPLLLAPIRWIQIAIAPGAAPDVPMLLFAWAVSVAALWTLVRLAGERWGWRRALTIVPLVWFSTPLWFYGRTLFTEPFIVAALVFALFAATRGRMLSAGLLLGAAFWLKESTLVLALPLMALWMFEPMATVAEGRKSGASATASRLRFLAGFGIAAMAWCAKNVLVYGAPFETFQPFQRGDLGAGLTGLSFDGSHGLLPFAPIAIAALGGWLRRPPPGDRRVVWGSLALFVLWILLVASWVDWTGGSCYGPRLLVPALPLLIVPLMTVAESGIGRLIVAVAAALGALVQAGAAADPFFAFWSAKAIDVVMNQPVAAIAGGVGAGWWGLRNVRVERDSPEGGRVSSY